MGITSQSKKEGKYQESINSSPTPDPGYQWKIDNFTITLSPFPAGDHKASINRGTCQNSLRGWRRKTGLSRTSKIILLTV